MNSRIVVKEFIHNRQVTFSLSEEEEKMIEILDNLADEQVEACVAALKKELHLWLPENRMQHIEDVCRDARLAKRGE